MPIAQAVLLENFPPEKRRLSMSIFAVGIILAPVIGPVLGGWITDNYSWHWIFFYKHSAWRFSGLFVE